jgi:LmbE family N-acetylglucosaminyl deacetylase
MQEIPQAFARVLAVGAHPDDAEFFAGATLANLAASGARVATAVCTDGRRGGRELADAAGVRRREAEDAARALGAAEVAWLGFEDARLEAGEPLRERLAAEIRRQRPELVLTHDPRTLWTRAGDRVSFGHSDHRAAGQGLLDAVYPRALSPNFYAGAGAPWCPREIWLFDTDQADLVIDAAQGWERKLAALRSHASQEAVGPGLAAPAEEMARRVGSGGLGEGFARLRIW